MEAEEEDEDEPEEEDGEEEVVDDDSESQQSISVSCTDFIQLLVKQFVSLRNEYYQLCL